MGGKTGGTKGTTKSRNAPRTRKAPAAVVVSDAGALEAAAALTDSAASPPAPTSTGTRRPRRSAKQAPAVTLSAEAAPAEAAATTVVATTEHASTELRPAKSRKRSATPRKRNATPAPPVADTPGTTDTPEPTFADALASAFIVHPSEVGEDWAAAPSADAPPAADEALEPDPVVELPFIIDTPPPAPSAQASSDEWVDLVLEPSKPQPPRRGRAASAVPTTAAAKPAGARTAVAKSVAATGTPARTAAPKAAPAKAAPKSAPATTTPAVAAGTRWWLVAPLLLVAALVLYFSRPGGASGPVPAGVIGTWTTSFWMYEHQTLEITRDSVFLTLDEPEEGRFPITKVEVTDAGREEAVKLTYRTSSGTERVLDFFADRDPTTALRFRANSALVWVRGDE